MCFKVIPVKLLYGHHGWDVRIPITRRGEYWLERQDNRPITNDIICVFEFPSAWDAESWLRSEAKFHDAGFPSPYGCQVFTAPINFRPTFDRDGNTFIMMEIPRVIMDKFREEYAPRMREVLRKLYPYDDQLAVQCVGINHLRGSWVKPKSILVCLRFKSASDAKTFWDDPELERIREEIRNFIDSSPWYSSDQWFHPTAVAFTFTETRV